MIKEMAIVAKIRYTHTIVYIIEIKNYILIIVVTNYIPEGHS